MAYYFVGGELEAFSIEGPTPAEVTSNHDSAYQRCCLVCTDNVASLIKTPALGSLTTVWVHSRLFWSAIASGGATYTLMSLENASGTPIFRVSNLSTGTGQCYYWNGSSFVTVGSTFTIPVGAAAAVDLKLVCGVSGSFELYFNGTLAASGAISDADVDNVSKVRWGGGTNHGSQSSRMHHSEFIVADQSTIGHRVRSLPPNAAGNYTAWTGAFGDVDETVTSDTDIISGAADTDKETFKSAARTLANMTIRAVGITAQARKGETGPANMRFMLRKSAVDYAGSSIPLTTGYLPYVGLWAEDPSTTDPWSLSAANDVNLEYGVEALT